VRGWVPLVAGAAAALGALGGERQGAGAATAWLAAGAVGLVAAWACRGPRGRAVLAVTAVALLAGGSMQRALDGLEGGPVVALAEGSEPVTIGGRVATDPVTRAYSTMVVVRTDTVTVEAGPTIGVRRSILLRASGADASPFRVVAAGDRVVVAARLGPLPSRLRRCRWAHVAAAGDRAQLLALAPARDPLFRAANAVRERVQAGTRQLAPADASVLDGFLLGDTRAIPRPTADAFRASGLSHLLAVSGANVAFVLALLRPLRSRLRMPSRFASGIAVLVVFAVVTRWEPSVLRASVMAACAMGGEVAGRPVASARALGYAVVVLLIVDPFLVHQVGFALSCAATLGIVAVGSRLSLLLRGPRWLREAFGVALAAQVGVTPVLLVAFGSVPPLSVIANLCAVPVAEPVTVVGLIAGAAASLPGVGGLARPWLAVAGLLVRWVAAVARAAAALS
jgi:competence protein ComEC